MEDGVFLGDNIEEAVVDYTVKDWDGFMDHAIFVAFQTVPFYD